MPRVDSSRKGLPRSFHQRVQTASSFATQLLPMSQYASVLGGFTDSRDGRFC